MPPSYLRGRRQVTAYEHDDQGRVVRAVTASPWTAEDRALLLALRRYEDTLCPGCGQPIETARHPDNDGFFEVTAAITCWGCTARENHGTDGELRPVEYLVISDTRDYDAAPLPPLVLAPVGDRPTAPPTPSAGGDSTLGGD